MIVNLATGQVNGLLDSVTLASNFNFPDGQPHVSLGVPPGPVQLVARIASSDDLVRLLCAQNILQRHGPRPVKLRLGYVMGGRMDRPMPSSDQGEHPFTLKVIADCIRTAGFDSIEVFDPHSDVTPALLGATPILPIRQVQQALGVLGRNTVLVAPDAGAAKRLHEIGEKTNRPVIYCSKHRDPNTGKLTKFRLDAPLAADQKHLLIVDDICDGGRTFTGLAEVLRAAGAERVSLYVSHGIFSGPTGFAIPGIDRVFTTDSYQFYSPQQPPEFTVLPWT